MKSKGSFIPLSKPYITEQVLKNIGDVLTSGKLSGDGVFCHKVEKKLCDLLSAQHVLLTTSGTHALELSMMLLDAKPGDEVILPSFTFSSTANAVLLAGLKPVFCDLDPATMNMDMTDVERKITDRTRCVIPVHYAGVPCDMDRLIQICQGKNIQIVEDAAQALGSKWKDKHLGTIGKMNAFSFHDTKNVMCGEGGAFVTNDPDLAERAYIVCEKGTNRAQFMRGQVDKYTWMQKGSSYVLAEPLAAILDVQVDLLAEMNQKRKQIYEYYMDRLKPLQDSGMVTLPTIPEHGTSNYHLCHILLKNEDDRNGLMDFLRKRDIGATFHYIPFAHRPAGLELGYKKGDLPATEEYAARLLRLPLFPGLTLEQAENIVDEIYDWNSSLNTPF